jgi:hypothetical protein
VSRLKKVARETAVRSNGGEDGFDVVVSADDIRNVTGRQRVRDSILERHADFLSDAGFPAAVDYESKVINVRVEPILKSSYNWRELGEAASLVDELTLREGSRMQG